MKLIATTSAQRRMPAFRAQVTAALILCGGVGVAGVGAAVAATPNGDVPAVTVKYKPSSLMTDDGARILYRRIVAAAEQVCPQNPGSVILSGAVQACRAQSIARAVEKINDSRLAAVHDAASRRG